MIGVDVVGSVTVLTETDPAACDQAALTDVVAVAQRVRGWPDSYDARIAMRARELATAGVGDPACVVLADGGRRSGRAARDAESRAGVCAEMPDVFDALAAGAVSAAHVDAIARLARKLDDAGKAELRDLESAIVGSGTRSVVEVFEREMRDLERILTRANGADRLACQRQQRTVTRWVDRVTGMCHTHVELDPEADAEIAAVFDAAWPRSDPSPTTGGRSSSCRPMSSST